MEIIEVAPIAPVAEWILMLIILGLIVFCLIMALVVRGDDKSVSGWWARRMRRVRKWPRRK